MIELAQRAHGCSVAVFGRLQEEFLGPAVISVYAAAGKVHHAERGKRLLISGIQRFLIKLRSSGAVSAYADAAFCGACLLKQFYPLERSAGIGNNPNRIRQPDILPAGDLGLAQVILGLHRRDNGAVCLQAKRVIVACGNLYDVPPGGNAASIVFTASDSDDREVSFRVGKRRKSVMVPYYTGFVGQWGHDGHTTGYLKDAQVAWVGTHRHSSEGDEPYELTYMFHVALDIPEGIGEVQLPDDAHVVVFAATVANDVALVAPAAPLFETSLLPGDAPLTVAQTKAAGQNLLKDAAIVAVSGEVNHGERAALLVDGNEQTKWCDNQAAPNYVVFDLGRRCVVSRWRLLNAACEQASYITRTCLLQGRNAPDEEWRTLDMIDGNRKNRVDRSFAPSEVRYVRLYVVSPTQGLDAAARIYEFELLE